MIHLDCGGKVLRDAAFSLRIGNQSGVAEYLAAAVQMNHVSRFILESLFGNVLDQIDDSAGVSPFVVVPREQLHQVAFDHARVRRVQYR